MKECSRMAACYKYIIQNWHNLSIPKGMVE